MKQSTANIMTQKKWKIYEVAATDQCLQSLYIFIIKIKKN